jgi:hypothetical protein
MVSGGNFLKRLFYIVMLFVLLLSVYAQTGFTEITDWNSIFGGNVTANGFYEYDGTYVIPIYKVDWSQGTGQFYGTGLNISLNTSSLTNAIILDWQNITGKPTLISYWINDVGYLTRANVSNNLSDYNNNMNFITIYDLTWNNISGKPTGISYWINDVGYITISDLTWTNISGKPSNVSYFINDAGYITLSNLSYLEQGIASLNATKSGIGNCPAGFVVQNLTTGNPQCVQMVVSEIDPIFLLNNLTIWNAIWSKLDATDQRYNDTALIYQIENDLYTNINNLNVSLQNQINAISKTNVQGDGIYTYNTTSGNVTTIHFNETKMNSTITSITGIFEENVTFSVSGGVGTGTTTRCCSANSEILEVAVFPTTITNKYKFSSNSTISSVVVDTDRTKHTGNWIVQHNGVVVPSGENVQYYVTNADTDETFRVRLRWEQ